MAASLECARAEVTTGEWSAALREVFGEYRAPTGVSGTVGLTTGPAGSELSAVRDRVRATGEELGEKLRLLVGKPGLDGHSNGAEQIAVRARDAGFEVIHQGIRLTPEQIVSAAVAEDVHLVGISILSGSHMELVPEVLARLRAEGIDDVPVIVGGILPDSDARALKALGVAEVFPPKDFGPHDLMSRFVAVIRQAHWGDVDVALGQVGCVDQFGRGVDIRIEDDVLHCGGCGDGVGNEDRPPASITSVRAPRRSPTSAVRPTKRIRLPRTATASAWGLAGSAVWTEALKNR